jgi:hypothetical protein
MSDENGVVDGGKTPVGLDDIDDDDIALVMVWGLSPTPVLVCTRIGCTVRKKQNGFPECGMWML